MAKCKALTGSVVKGLTIENNIHHMRALHCGAILAGFQAGRIFVKNIANF